MTFPLAIKVRAYAVDPGCWRSYSGRSPAFKRMVDARRCAALDLAEREYGDGGNEMRTEVLSALDRISIKRDFLYMLTVKSYEPPCWPPAYYPWES